jgi:hypothetical protein
MLGPPDEYTSLQLACGLAVDVHHQPGSPDPNTRERLSEDEEWAALRGRGKSDDEIDEVRLLIKRIAGWMKPIVCMAEDDIEMGLGMGLSRGLITSEQQQEMVATLVRFAQPVTPAA